MMESEVKMGWRENKIKYSLEYAKKNVSQVSLKLNKLNDADIIEQLNNVPNIQGYIKALIRADIEKNKQ